MPLEKRAVGEPAQAYSDDVVGSEPWIHGQQFEETAREEARAHHENDRRRQLRDHEALAEPRAAYGSTRLSAPALQPVDQLRLGSRHSGGDTEGDSR